MTRVPDDNRPRLVLASASPRRKQLLQDAGLMFAIIDSGAAEEREPEEGAQEFALRMAVKKALAVSEREPQALVVGADTVVEAGGQVLGKPQNPKHAWEMLEMLSGRTHTVVTGVALAQGSQVLERFPVFSRVRFRPLSTDEIRAYIAKGEPFDKAGGYAVQGTAASFIVHVEGSYTNVMGLPLKETLAALKRRRVI